MASDDHVILIKNSLRRSRFQVHLLRLRSRMSTKWMDVEPPLSPWMYLHFASLSDLIDWNVSR